MRVGVSKSLCSGAPLQLDADFVQPKGAVARRASIGKQVAWPVQQ